MIFVHLLAFFLASGLSSQGSWAVHPDWLYCRYNYAGSVRSFASQEERVVYFLDKKAYEGSHFHWRGHRSIDLRMKSKDIVLFFKPAVIGLD